MKNRNPFKILIEMAEDAPGLFVYVAGMWIVIVLMVMCLLGRAIFS